MKLFLVRDAKTKGELTFEGGMLRCNNVPALYYLVQAVREKINPIKYVQQACISHPLEIVNAETGEVVEKIPRQEG